MEYKKKAHIEFVFIDKVSLDDFRLFIESLTIERETWSLDMEIYDKDMCEGKDDIETWYNVQSRYNKMIATNKLDGSGRRIIQQTIFAKHKGNVIGFVSGKSLNTGVSNPEVVEISCVVKKEYQNRGMGTQLLLLIENYISKKGFKKIVGKQFITNKAAHRYVEKAGWVRTGGVDDMVFVEKNIEKGN